MGEAHRNVSSTLPFRSAGVAPALQCRRDAGTTTTPLKTWQRVGLTIFFLVVLAFAAPVEMRSAFMSRRMGDLDCFLRAAWAVRSGADLYAVTDDNGFHYNY